MTISRAAVFLDRDGTINEEVDFLVDPAEVRLIPGAGKAVRMLNEAGVVTCVISNQSGIARGLLSEEDLVPIHATLVRELDKDGARLDRIYFCPHHPTDGRPPYNIDCECRKPKPGMLRQAEKEFGLELAQCFVVGDRMVDIKTGASVGASTILVRTGYGKSAELESTATGSRPDFVADSIVDATRIIVEQLKNRKRN